MKLLLHLILLPLGFLLLSLSAQAQHSGIISDENCMVMTPNAFTPNDDGINDFYFFTFKENCTPTNYNIQIMDRWGRLVFESKNHQEKWDGRFQGQNVKAGAYLWIMRTNITNPSTQQNETLEKKGTLLLIR